MIKTPINKIAIPTHWLLVKCSLKNQSENNKEKIEVFFKKPILVAAGQSCVFYDKDICLGGGVIV